MNKSIVNITKLLVIIILASSCSKVTKVTITKSDRLFALAKTYGYIKYFHPSDEAASLDWDSFAVLASERISNSENLKETLEELFLPIAPSVHFTEDDTKLERKTSSIEDIDSLQDIYWMHLGNGERKIGNNYKSMRMHRKAIVLPESNNDFGSIRKSLNSSQLRGKKVLITSSVKPNSKYMGSTFIRLSVKSNGGDWQHYDSLEQNLNKNIWNTLKLSAHIPENTEKINLYLVSITSTGSMDVDYLKMQIKDNESWIDFKLENSEFDNTDTFQTDWRPRGDNHQFNLITKDGNQLLNMSRHTGFPKDIPPLFLTDSIKDRFIKENIGFDLKVIVPIVVSGNKTTTFPKPNHESYHTLIKDIELLSTKISITDKNVRLANIIKTWSTLNHFFPYFDLTEVDWKKQFYSAIEKNELDKTYKDHLTTLKLMVAPLKDSHIGVYSFSTDSYFPPIFWELIENKLVITNVLDSTLTIRPGDRVTKINSILWQKYWEESYQKVSGATQTRRHYKNIEESLIGEKNSNLVIETLSMTKELSLKRNLTEETYDDMLSKDTIAFKEIKQNVFYVNMSNTSWQYLKDQLPKLAKAKGVIFDLRGYPTGGMMNLLPHLTNDVIYNHQSFTPKISHPNDLGKSFLEFKKNPISPKSPYIMGKKVFLTNGSAISYSETFLAPIEFYKLADIVGEQTAGSTGNTNNIHLFGDILIPWTGKKVLLQDGSVFHGRGVIPNHPVKKTISGIKEGRDEYLEYAINLINDYKRE